MLFSEGVFELATFQMKPGGPAVWGKAFQAAVGTHMGSGYAHSVGVFHSEFGQLNQCECKQENNYVFKIITKSYHNEFFSFLVNLFDF